ncbi:hypothetical protein EXM98_19115 [Clostridium botulinum]|nr:hypothetical protein [Clostridium botulinum]NFC62326.1 hypothetical protein [Clostridium botulinum]NFC71264.1 hypothetical protein [Clostridium botulinum]NFE38975.1 hypothetical protein [Clostridium botulinum]NFE43641.1 hypothetical protein [Clostridium botulinum]
MDNVQLFRIALDSLHMSTIDLVVDIAKQMMKSDPQKGDSKDRKEMLKILENQTKVLRELAISRRIDTAEKVSIEEYYDNKADGKLGAQVDSDGLNLGISGSGERVVKRVYTFEGWREGGLEGIDKDIIEKLKIQSDILTEKSVEVAEFE